MILYQVNHYLIKFTSHATMDLFDMMPQWINFTNLPQCINLTNHGHNWSIWQNHGRDESIWQNHGRDRSIWQTMAAMNQFDKPWLQLINLTNPPVMDQFDKLDTVQNWQTMPRYSKLIKHFISYIPKIFKYSSPVLYYYIL